MTPLLKASTERIKLTFQNYTLENKLLKNTLMQMLKSINIFLFT